VSNSETRASAKAILIAVSLGRRFSMVRKPNVRIDEGHFRNLNPGRLIPFSEGFSAIGCGIVSTDHFWQQIRSRLQLASAQGRKDLTIECGELYWFVSKLPVFDPWMIFCCNAMRAEMATTHRLTFDDCKASLLTIHYALPRH
jgi:hypothetical protein